MNFSACFTTQRANKSQTGSLREEQAPGTWIDNRFPELTPVTDNPAERELERQIEQARRLVAVAGPSLNSQLLERIKELERQLAEIRNPKT